MIQLHSPSIPKGIYDKTDAAEIGLDPNPATEQLMTGMGQVGSQAIPDLTGR